jgi:hypothetical protein
VGGFITLERGVHHARAASASAALAQMEGTTTPPAICPPSPLPPRAAAEPTAAERRPECRAVPWTTRHSPSRTGWGRHIARSQRQGSSRIASAGSTGQRRDRVIAAAAARTRGKVSEPAGLTIESPSAPIMQAEKAEEAGSKMDDPLCGSWGRRRWPCPRGIPEVPSASLRWAK